MREVAREMAKYGRHGDDMLLHVSRKELEGIRALTGRNFTRNPDTGLPEAFDFADLIPVIAGVAGTIVGGPIVGALASGATSAGKAAIQGESAGDALTKGLISGVTSYAGGQLLSGVGEAANMGAVANAGSDAAQSLGQAALADSAGQAANINAASQGIGSLNPGVIGDGAMASASNFANAAPASGIGSIGQAANSPISSNVANASISGATVNPAPSVGERFSQFGDRLGNIASDPGAALSQFGSNVMGNIPGAAIAASGTAMQLGDMMGGGQPQVPGLRPRDPNKYPEQFPANPRRWNAPPAGYQPGVSPEYRYFAEGGLATLREGQGGYTANLMNEAKAALLGEHPRPEDALNRFRETFGDEALTTLRDRLVGGRVRGAGSGMDDLVPGDIEGREKVRLADGEFVLPAPIVSAIGDGSTDHGSRRLQEMVQSIYKQMYKTDGLPKPIKKGTLLHEK